MWVQSGPDNWKSCGIIERGTPCALLAVTLPFSHGGNYAESLGFSRKVRREASHRAHGELSAGTGSLGPSRMSPANARVGGTAVGLIDSTKSSAVPLPKRSQFGANSCDSARRRAANFLGHTSLRDIACSWPRDRPSLGRPEQSFSMATPPGSVLRSCAVSHESDDPGCLVGVSWPFEVPGGTARLARSRRPRLGGVASAARRPS